MTDRPLLRLQFRIPISPTPGFFSQVRFFAFALDQLGPPYSDARVCVYVGDDCDLDAVRAANAWSRDGNVDWVAVPAAICAEFGIHGTADWRWVPPADDADIVILSDADTVLLRDIDPLLEEMPTATPAMRGHMAHRPPPSSGGGISASTSTDFWPTLFARFGAPWPERLFSYSMDWDGRLPQAPAYFNLGMVAVNPSALQIIGRHIFDFQRRLASELDSHMRCQISPSLLAYRDGVDIGVLPAPYNTANDLVHMRLNHISADDIRVLHYLRNDEFERSQVFQDPFLDSFLATPLANPANRAVQALARAYRRSRPELGPLP